jgi:hypothetical protein
LAWGKRNANDTSAQYAVVLKDEIIYVPELEKQLPASHLETNAEFFETTNLGQPDGVLPQESACPDGERPDADQ